MTSNMKSFPEILQTKNNFKLLNSEAKSLRAPSAEEWENNLRPRLAGHCLFYARTNEVIFEKYPKRAHVLMMLRDEGSFCFPGGVVDDGEAILDGLNRELFEEINLDLDKFAVEEKDFVCAHIMKGHSWLGELELQFYAKEVSEEDIKEIEKNALNAEEYGIETNGVVRVPLHSRNNRGLPLFLANKFAGNSKNQLLYTLLHQEIFELDEIEKVLCVADIQKAY